MKHFTPIDGWYACYKQEDGTYSYSRLMGVVSGQKISEEGGIDTDGDGHLDFMSCEIVSNFDGYFYWPDEKRQFFYLNTKRPQYETPNESDCNSQESTLPHHT